MALKLNEIKDPVFEVDLGNGDVRRYDPFAIAEKMETVKNVDGSEPNSSEGYDRIRTIFGFPTQAEYDAAPEPKPFTPSRHQVQWLSASIGEFIANLAVSKKIQELSRKP